MTLPRKTERRSTLYDVAREAGVSHQTVSRVINDHPNVSLKTRRKVLKVIEELNFVPNKAAQMLTSQRSFMLEMISTDVYNTTTATLAALVRTARKYGYHVTIQSVPLDELQATVDSTAARVIDGLILAVSESNIALDLPELPLVRLAGTPDKNTNGVFIDQPSGVQAAIHHLIENGHRRIAHLHGFEHIYDGQIRHEAWLSTLQSYGLEPGPSLNGSFALDGGYQAMLHLLDSQADFTAVFAGNDLMAQGAIRALYDRGLHVPDDISVVGFDDAPEAAYGIPRLTTVRQNFYQMGELAIEMLLEVIDKPTTPIHQRIMNPELIVRESTRKIS